MKRIITLVLALTMAASLAACAGSGGAATDSASGQTSGQSTIDSETTPSAPEISFSGEIGGEITISCYDTMRYKQSLEDAAKLFEEKYPGTKVNIETFSAMPEVKTSQQGNKTMVMMTGQDDPQGRADYINKINTALMSGGGADILAMDVLPVQKYAESGQLENLGAYMDADTDFNRADYRQNILDAVSWQGGTWFIPTDYSFNYYTYDSTLISADAANFGTGSTFTVEQLMALGTPSYDGSAKLFNTPDYVSGKGGGMWNNLLTENYASFADIPNKTANFNDGSFAGLLESVKQYAEQGYIPKGATGQTDANAIMRQGAEEPTERYAFKSNSNLSLLSHFSRGSGMRMSISFGSGAAGIETDDEIAGIAANKDGSVPFTYNQAYGINANSANKETAWAFIKFLMGGEAQSAGGMGARGLPLHNESRSKYIETLLSSAFTARGEAGASIPQEVLEQFNEATERFSDQINTWEIGDTTVNDMIAAEVVYFFDGTKTAAEVASALQNKVGLYLSE